MIMEMTSMREFRGAEDLMRRRLAWERAAEPFRKLQYEIYAKARPESIIFHSNGTIEKANDGLIDDARKYVAQLDEIIACLARAHGLDPPGDAGG